jgi:hypothetical protein
LLAATGYLLSNSFARYWFAARHSDVFPFTHPLRVPER